ncbi:Carbohydrate esterase family 4 protein [Mycena venus]|uniref:chitin deacetylase n=1 Tax=Mycena venus TaxID=2733690 RepID=A0A8H7D3Z5_9AGAR|nr:Carbohydrate esterase family 4 protein [Mycena venus]
MRSATLLISVAALLVGSRADPTEEQINSLTGKWMQDYFLAFSLTIFPQFSDPTAECAPYSYAPVTNALSAFPPIGTPIVGIVAGDTAAQTKFDSIKGGIPNIQPKVEGLNGTLGNITYAPTDPDCWWTYGQCTTPEPRTLGYGFDDGPNCSHNAFYDYLTEKKQKATMFFIGTNVMWQPLQALRAALDGHEICVHSWSHHAMTAFTNEQVFAELWYTMQAIKLVTGYTPTCWRPPQGDVDDRVRYIAQALNLDNILWKYDAFDWKVASGQATPQEVQANYDALVADVGNGTFDTVGAIMLTHELDNYTMQTAMDNYPKLAAAFNARSFLHVELCTLLTWLMQHIVPVGVAYNKTHPYVETNFTMPNFAQCKYFSASAIYLPNLELSPTDIAQSGVSGGSNSSGSISGSASGSQSSGAAGPQGGISAAPSLRLPLVGVVFALLGGAALAL